MREIKRTSKFKRDQKRELKGQYRLALSDILPEIVENLANDIPLAPKYRDHALVGNWIGYRECHVLPDLMLIYRLFDAAADSPATLVLARLGSHAVLGLK